MAQQATAGRRYLRAFVSGFFVAVPVTVTVLDRFAYVARVEGASMQPSLNPDGGSDCDVVLLNRWSVRNYQVQRGDIVSVMHPSPSPREKEERSCCTVSIAQRERGAKLLYCIHRPERERSEAAVLYPSLQCYVNASPQRWKQHIYVQYLGNNKNNLYANEASVVCMLNGAFNAGCFLF
uniref:Mitochondrial inner membrane protease subunit 2 n=1 Tax=Sparus aurata TaxID=8175 RepID=A0A671TZ86_SPAAU